MELLRIHTPDHFPWGVGGDRGLALGAVCVCLVPVLTHHVAERLIPHVRSGRGHRSPSPRRRTQLSSDGKLHVAIDETLHEWEGSL